MRRQLQVLLFGLLAVSCGSDDEVATPSTSVASTMGTTDSLPVESSTTSTSTSIAPESMRGKRYCEVLLLSPTASGIEATVYNSFPMGDCPEDQWRELDGTAIASEQGAALALLNGPRYWLMDMVERATDDVISLEFGRIAMNRYATVAITDTSSIGRSYSPQTVDRKSTFIFRAGQMVFRLTADDGRQFIMQSWSQQVDAELDEDSLATLGERLALPEGWTYESVTLTTDLVIGESGQPAQVLQDELLNSYSLIG
ncbi:MAG: hypothetical protein RIS41_769 [Actinomycetota bacterium]|jgi:hypothetical protein